MKCLTNHGKAKERKQAMAKYMILLATGPILSAMYGFTFLLPMVK
jgi:hypothetical protein